MQNTKTNILSSVGGATAQQEPAMLQVHKWIGNLEHQVEDMAKALTQLEERLSLVLRQNPHSDSKEQRAPDECLVPLADKLRDLERSIERGVCRIQSILIRSEI